MLVERLVVTKAQKGERWAFRLLYEKYVGRIFGYLWKRTGSREDAEDVSSEVWVAVVERLAGFEGKSSFKNWVFGIAKHKLMDYYRKKYGEKTLPLLEEVLPLFDKDIDESKEEGEGVAEEKLEKVLSRLTEREQKILRLRFLRGYSVKETAEELTMSEGAVKTAQSRALKKAKRM